MKLEYRVLELADGHEGQCDFCVLDYDDPNNLALNTSLATHEMVALDKKTGDYTDTAFICNECKQDFDSNVLLGAKSVVEQKEIERDVFVI